MLLSTLITVLLVTAVATVLQQRVQSNVRVMARLEHVYDATPGHDAVFERLRGLIADAMLSDTASVERPVLDGTLFRMLQGSQDWDVRVQDVQGVVDVYLAPPELLALLPINVGAFTKAREVALSRLPRGARFPTIESSLAQFGVNPQDVRGLVTQSASTVGLRITEAAVPLRTDAARLSPSLLITGQVQRVHIEINEVKIFP